METIDQQHTLAGRRGELGRFMAWVSAPFSIDLRTLALFRICLGAVLIADLVTRARALTAHYTDAGIWHRFDAQNALGEAGFSLHLLGGSAGFQSALFLLAGMLALLLMLGYRTRIVSVLCWLMLASLNHRNYLVLQTSDTLLLALLFWSLFLPLGARYSVDAALNRTPMTGSRVCSPASAALVLQVLYVYFFGALLKVGDTWMETGDAVYVALHFSHYVSPLGEWFGEWLSPEALRGLTWYTWYIELLGPILVLSPFQTARIRAVVVPGLMLLHVGFALLLEVGLYPYLSLTSLLLLIPGAFWDRIRASLTTPERQGVTIYYDGPCVFCHKTCLLLRTFLLVDSTPIRPAQDDAAVHELMQTHHSWVLEDHDGQRYVRWDAMVMLFRRSWLLAPVASVLGSAPLRALGERFYGWVAAHRAGLGRFTALVLPWQRFDGRLPLAVHGAVCALLLMVLLHNVARLPQTSIEMPWTLSRIVHALMLNQYWTMFAPNPGGATQWLIVEGTLQDGRRVDLYRSRFTQPTIERPAEGSHYFDGYRWRKFFNQSNVATHWPTLASYYCRRWNAAHPDSQAVRAVGTVLIERTQLGVYDERSQWEYEVQPLGMRSCR